MLTQNSTKGDIQKVALQMIMKQYDRFTEQDIFDLVISQFEEEVDENFVFKVVSKTIEYCKREIHLTDIIDGAYVINPERRELINAFLSHEGVTV